MFGRRVLRVNRDVFLGRASNEVPAELGRFADWLVEAGEVDRLTCTRLWNLYGEFVMFTETSQLSKGRFYCRLKHVGIHRYREGAGRRRWLYRIA